MQELIEKIYQTYNKVAPYERGSLHWELHSETLEELSKEVIRSSLGPLPVWPDPFSLCKSDDAECFEKAREQASRPPTLFGREIIVNNSIPHGTVKAVIETPQEKRMKEFAKEAHAQGKSVNLIVYGGWTHDIASDPPPTGREVWRTFKRYLKNRFHHG